MRPKYFNIIFRKVKTYLDFFIKKVYFISERSHIFVKI